MSYIVDTGIPCGNACDVEVRGMDGGAEVAFAPDPHGGPECMWFCFRLVPVGAPARGTLRLVLKNPHNMLGGGRPAGMRPVIRPAGGTWRRLGEPAAVELPDGRLNVVWTIDAPEAALDVAWCYPYALDDLRTLLTAMQGRLHSDVIGVSQKARPIVRVCNDYGRAGGGRPGIYAVARQHSGETPGSWVLDGFLRHMASLGGDAPLVWAVPLADIDGVTDGNYGKDHFPWDLNRAWGNPPMRHETLVMRQDIGRWKKRCRPMLGIDLHAPGACETDGMYAYVPDREAMHEMHDRTVRWTARVAEALGDRFAAADFARVARYPSRWESPGFACFLWHEHDLPAFSLETPYALTAGRTLTQDDYREAGRRLAAGVCDALRAM